MFDFSDVTEFAARLVVSGDIEDEWQDTWKPKLVEEIRSRAPVRTGTLKASIRETEDGVIVGAPYGAYVEYGTSDTAPQPFVTPSADRLAAPSTEDAARRVLSRLL
jgi:HK97 gp10 family phage protein